MSYDLIKCSMPGWKKSFDTKDEVIDELREHICSSCLTGPSLWVGKNGELVEDDSFDEAVDVEYDGKWFYCRDLSTLLSTSCGCEFEVEFDGKPYWKV